MRARAPASTVALAIVVLAGCVTRGASEQRGPTSNYLETGRTASGSSSPDVGSASPPSLPALEHLPSSDVMVDGAPAGVLWAYGSIWVMSHRSTTLRRVNPRDLTVTGAVDTGVLGCGDIVAGADSVWVSGCGATPGLVRVDPRRLRVVSTHAELNGLGAAFFAGSLWNAAGTGAGFGLRRADPDRPEDAHEVRVAGLGVDAGVVEAAGSVWVGDSEAFVYRVDPQTEQVLAAIPLPLDPGQSYLIAHDGAAWYLDHGIGAIARIDPTTNAATVLAVRPVRPPEYRGVAASSAPRRPGELWVRSGSDEAWLVDTRQGKVIRRVAIADGGGGDLVEVDGMLWVAGFGLDTLQRVSLG